MLSYMVSTQNQKAGQLAIPQQTGAPVSSVPVPVEKIIRSN